jgi:hypothetical protein
METMLDFVKRNSVSHAAAVIMAEAESPTLTSPHAGSLDLASSDN